MERLVSDPDYCLELIQKISQSSIEIEGYFDNNTLRTFMGKKINKHASTQQLPETIYKQWPDSFKFIYQHTLNYSNLKSDYIKLGYDTFPEGNEKEFSIKGWKIIQTA